MIKLHFSWQNATNTLDNERAVLPTIVWLTTKWGGAYKVRRRMVVIGWWAWGLAIMLDTSKSRRNYGK
jgi:hypothetical protein